MQPSRLSRTGLSTDLAADALSCSLLRVGEWMTGFQPALKSAKCQPQRYLHGSYRGVALLWY